MTFLEKLIDLLGDLAPLLFVAVAAGTIVYGAKLAGRAEFAPLMWSRRGITKEKLYRGYLIAWVSPALPAMFFLRKIELDDLLTLPVGAVLAIWCAGLLHCGFRWLRARAESAGEGDGA